MSNSFGTSLLVTCQRQPIFSCALFLLAAGCGASKDAKPGSSTTQVEQRYAHAPSNRSTGVAALAGSWSGSAEVKGYGGAIAVVTLNHKGEGVYLVTLSGVSNNGTVQVSFWDGRWLHAEALGHEERLRATLSGDTLRLELPYVGTVILQRAR